MAAEVEANSQVRPPLSPKKLTNNQPNNLSPTPNQSNPIQTTCSEQPISYDSFLENLLDPAHVEFAHDGVAGAKEGGGGACCEERCTRAATPQPHSP
jgi:phenylpropionate dioxygenase-like ring-hydroxylating dioxygenase large terminal subunit